MMDPKSLVPSGTQKTLGHVAARGAKFGHEAEDLRVDEGVVFAHGRNRAVAFFVVDVVTLDPRTTGRHRC